MLVSVSIRKNIKKRLLCIRQLIEAQNIIVKSRYIYLSLNNEFINNKI